MVNDFNILGGATRFAAMPVWRPEKDKGVKSPIYSIPDINHRAALARWSQGLIGFAPRRGKPLGYLRYAGAKPPIGGLFGKFTELASWSDQAANLPFETPVAPVTPAPAASLTVLFGSRGKFAA